MTQNTIDSRVTVHTLFAAEYEINRESNSMPLSPCLVCTGSGFKLHSPIDHPFSLFPASTLNLKLFSLEK
jgi:hypothetical protein